MKPYRTKPQYEDSPAVLMARVLTIAATNAVRADVSSIALKVFDVTDGTAPIATAVPVVASTIFDTLQTDARWTTDATGYNFRYVTLASHLPAGNRVYRFEFILTMADATTIPVVFEVPTVPLLGS